ncbi:hypothetical protein N7463_010842 [Penicillium fimorum]|uniref:Uncharacterized protein n=1 Tax=Penicillium fimorum TaxID=1882269 RepID=A0A9X0C238_9EURO|nr:hypothetical protein N7463_010842 [Penicillium fimorum]
MLESWPSFNKNVEGHSYWLLFGLNVAAGISVYFILPEIKGISLERMDTFPRSSFSDSPTATSSGTNVAAGESEGTSEKCEVIAIVDKRERLQRLMWRMLPKTFLPRDRRGLLFDSIRADKLV